MSRSNRRKSDRILRAFTWILVGFLLPGLPPATAQSRDGRDVRQEVFAGGELEDYLRVLQAGGAANWYPWAVRSFSPGEVEAMVRPDTPHPWIARYSFIGDSLVSPRVGWVAPRALATYNSAFAHGANDGALWSGRGVTTALRAGGWARVGPLTLVVAPEVFRAENRAFELAPTGAEGRLVYADPRVTTDGIDLPQRFGSDAYSRIDPGQTSLRADVGPLALGVSTANQFWGPATDHPLLLGDNAPGYLHLFAGSSHPINLGAGLLHGRLVWGKLEQSDFSPMDDSLAARFMSGFVATFRPRGVPGLELGAARFFHSPWRHGGPSVNDLLQPLQGFLKVGLDRDENGEVVGDGDNQLASVFMRWMVPRSGFEIYGEYGREDHSWNFRDFALEPDHHSAYMLGARKVWTGDAASWTVLRGELLNAEPSHLYRVRHQGRFYQHSVMRQGHTQRGQILGSPAGFGGAATQLAVDRYHGAGRWTLEWSRTVRDRRGSYWQGGFVERDAADTSQRIELQGLRFHGRAEVLASVAAIYQFNRYFGEDAFNLNLALGLTWRP